MFKHRWLGVLPLLVSAPVFALGITVSPWDYPSSSFSTLVTAGDYYPTSFESVANAATLSLSGAPSTPVTSNTECGATNPAWKISAYLSTTASGLTVRVKRTSNGSGGTLYSGESYVTLGASPITLLCGSGNVTGVSLQFQVDDMQTTDGNGPKSWVVRYTVDTL